MHIAQHPPLPRVMRAHASRRLRRLLLIGSLIGGAGYYIAIWIC